MKILLVGSKGRMGQEMSKLLNEQNIQFVGIDIGDTVCENFCPDVILDFSCIGALEQNLKLSKQYKCPIVIATTNHPKESIKKILQHSKSLPVFMSANFSVLFNLMLKISKNLGGNFDYVLTETHHKTKKDAPSGSAKILIKNLRKNKVKPKVVCHRVGNVIGEHELKIFAPNESLTVCHTALSRQVFCNGALLACQFINKKSNGFFGMEDMICDCM